MPRLFIIQINEFSFLAALHESCGYVIGTGVCLKGRCGGAFWRRKCDRFMGCLRIDIGYIWGI